MSGKKRVHLSRSPEPDIPEGGRRKTSFKETSSQQKRGSSPSGSPAEEVQRGHPVKNRRHCCGFRSGKALESGLLREKNARIGIPVARDVREDDGHRIFLLRAIVIDIQHALRLGVRMGGSAVFMTTCPRNERPMRMAMRKVDADTSSVVMMRQDASRQQHQRCQSGKKESEVRFEASAGHLPQSVIADKCTERRPQHQTENELLPSATPGRCLYFWNTLLKHPFLPFSPKGKGRINPSEEYRPHRGRGLCFLA